MYLLLNVGVLMIKPQLCMYLLLTLLITSTLPNVGFVSASNEKPIVVCTTSVLASIVRDLADEKVVVEVIASPTICPAHYDVKPSDVEAFRHADLILMHGFEPWVEELKRASGTEAPIVKIPGPWNTPKALKDKYTKVANALSEYLGIDMSERLKECLGSIDETANWLQKYAEEHGFRDKPVVCMLWQKNFIEFLGFKIIAIYGPPEKVSAKQYESIITNATKSHAVLVIDNIQSGTELGKKIASEIGAIEVAISNFPGIAPELNNITSVMKWNAQQIAEALENKDTLVKINELRNEVNTWRMASISISVIAIAELIIIIIMAKLRRR